MLDMDTAGSQAQAKARANMYAFLAALYLRPPETAFLRRLLDPDCLAELATFFGERAIAGLRDAAGYGAAEQPAAWFKQEFMDLFAVPTGRYVMPFEDVYLAGSPDSQETRGPLLGIGAVEVNRMYRETGAQLDRTCRELPTHIGVELSFMSFLCEREAAALSEEERRRASSQDGEQPAINSLYRQIQLKFLREHLNRWFPRLSRRIQENARSPFYRSLALITEELLSCDTVDLQQPRRSCPGDSGRSPARSTI